MIDPSTKDILKKYEQKLSERIKSENYSSAKSSADISREYSVFKQDMMPQISRYERLCQSVGNIINVKASQKDSEKIQNSINIAHLDINPGQVMGVAISALFLMLFTGILITVLVYLFYDNFSFSLFSLFLIFSLFVFYYYYTAPHRLAQKWRLKASSQMVPCILYVVAYMKHTSNLERAIAFVSEHLQPPLSLDFKKIFWDVETGKYPTIKESLDVYLEGWRGFSMEFVESFHLIESSLYEPSESGRVRILERALQVMLDGVYEKMLKYTHGIRGPLTNLYMLGIVLPTLALALLPLASTMLGGILKSYHIFILFDLVIPFFVFYLASQIMLKRPGGYGEADVIEQNPDYYKYISKKPYIVAGLIALPFFILGLLPLISHYLFGYDVGFKEIGLGIFGEGGVFDFRQAGNSIVGPFGLGAILLSLFFPLSIALFFSISSKMRTKELILARDSSKDLENEFASSLFQLGNRIGDGLPAEIAFSKVAESSKGQVTESFFKTVGGNINSAGMSLEDAIFDKKRGAILYFPSNLIATSMRILVESVKKGLDVAARALMSISEYIKNINKINERLKDLLAEIVSDMKSNMTFLAPLLAGVVIGLASMITAILAKLETLFDIAGDQSLGGFASLGSILNIFDLKSMIPPYYLQVAIGIYLVEIVFILTNTMVTINYGEDRLKATNEIGKNLSRSITLYFIIAFIAILVLSIIAGVALSGLSAA